MLFGLVYMNFGEYFMLRADSATCKHEYKLFINYSRKLQDIRKHFSPRK